MARLRASVVSAADGYLTTLSTQGYPAPIPASAYVWGSNSQVANNGLVLGVAYDLTRRPRYRDGAVETMDYLLGRNTLGTSYVTGYGTRYSHNQHHRFWAHEYDASLPNPPAGSLAGGPNSALQDPVAEERLPGCRPAACYVDDIGSYSTNEVAINWNAPWPGWRPSPPSTGTTPERTAAVRAGPAGSCLPVPRRPCGPPRTVGRVPGPRIPDRRQPLTTP